LKAACPAVANTDDLHHGDQPGGNGLLLGAGAALLMVACCALLPLLVAGGALARAGAFLRNPWVIGTGVALLAIAVVATVRRCNGGCLSAQRRR